MQSISYYLTHPKQLLRTALVHHGSFIPDKPYLKLLYRLYVGKKLNLKNPQTFTEKLQWLKLYGCKPEYTQMVDKYSAKEYVANIIGEEYIIPTYGVWEKPEDIEWEKLPEKFVLKTTHGGASNGVVICKDKSSFDKQAAIKKLNSAMKADIYKNLREPVYKHIHKRILAEMLLENEADIHSDLPDYKFFCFNGEPKYCQVITGRESKMCIDFFDKDWKHQPFHEPHNYPFADVEPQKPQNFEQMWNAARELAGGREFSRIDFYEVNKQTYFGEITFYPTSGLGGFNPENYDEIIGRMINLDGIRIGGGYWITVSYDSFEIKNQENGINDYKFYCFNGEVKIGMIASNRFTTHNFNYFDKNYNPLPITSSAGKPNPNLTEKPKNWDIMVEIAEKLSKDLIHVRVDLYSVKNNVYFGELTFFDASGYDDNNSEYWDKRWGEWINLPITHRGGGFEITLSENGYTIKEKKEELKDYKFYCFDGEPKMLYITSDREIGKEVKEDFFDAKTGELLPLNQRGYYNNPQTPALPKNFEKMKALAGVLSKNIPQLRVDFYEVGGKIYFGELTFFCGSGLCPFVPDEWERKVGSWINL